MKEIKFKSKDTIVKLVADEGKYIHKIGTDTYYTSIFINVINRELYEEVDSKPSYTRGDYKRKVTSLIREKYDQDDEFGLTRQKDSKPTKYLEYSMYVEDCKRKAKEILSQNV